MSETPEDAATDQGDASSVSVETFDQLTAKIAAEGSYIIQSADSTLAFKGNPLPDQVGVAHASTGAISMTLSNGIATLSTLVTRELFDAAGSLAALAETFRLHPQEIYGASAETQYIEHEIRTHLGIDPVLAYERAVNAGLPEGGFPEVLSAGSLADPWRAQHLRTILNCILGHNEMLAAVGSVEKDWSIGEVFPSPNDFVALMAKHHTQGFLLARLISEYFTRYEIGPLAKKGLAAEQDQDRRTDASGKRSNQKKHQRIAMLLTRIEHLLSNNPDIGRLGLKQVGAIAIKDCVEAEPNLWKQGKNQLDHYLDEIRSDILYRDRYTVIKGKTA